MGNVPAALAMNDMVSVGTVSRFTAQFYASLFRHGIVDLAASEARGLMQEYRDDWGAPVLFSHLRDNVLI